VTNRLLITLTMALLLALPSAWAQRAVMESEPNDTTADAMRLGGEAVIMGVIGSQDQDAYLWTVSDVDALKRWTFELHGIPGRLTIVEIVRLEYAENGVDVTGYEKLMKMGTRDGLKPSIHEDLLFEPGEYLLGVAAAGGGGGAFRPPSVSLSFGEEGGAEDDEGTEAGGYRLSITEGRRIPMTASPKPRETRERAHVARLGHEFAALTYEPTSWYRFDFDEKAVLERWEIFVQGPIGRDIKAILVNEAGESLASAKADSHGKLWFADLAPPAGSWWVELQKKGEDGYIQAIASTQTGQRVAGEEAEPNDKWQYANVVDFSQPLTGRFGKKGESDYFRFSLDEAMADQVLEFQLENSSENKLQICLLDSHHTSLQCREGKSTLMLPDLVLSAGDWGLLVSRGSEGTEYKISLTVQGPINPDTEAEPNDAANLASSVPAKNRIKGRFSGNDADYYRFVIAEEPQLWRFQVMGDGIQEVAFLDSALKQAQRIRPKSAQKRVRLDNVYLLPGVHHLMVKGKDGGSYTLLARAVGQPDPNGEREPNNDTRHMQHLAIGQTRTGYLQEKDDRDYYRFFLANWDRIRLTIQPPADGSVTAWLYWYSKGMKEKNPLPAGEAMVLEGLFPPGDYHLRLEGAELSEGEYTLKLERLDRFACAVDCEPNEPVTFANPIPPNFIIEGAARDWRDNDYFALPVRDEPTEWLLKPTPYTALQMIASDGDHSILEYDKTEGLFRGTVPAGTAYFLLINTKSDYRVELDYPGRPVANPSRENLPVSLELTLNTNEVAAYRRNGQRLEGNLLLHNESDNAQSLQLEAATSDYRWAVNVGESSVSIEAGAEVLVPVVINVPEDAWADWPVRTSIRAFDADKRQVETYQEVTAGRETPLVNPQWGWKLPMELRGGFNVAWSPLGSRLVGNYDSSLGNGFENIFNGIDVRGRGLILRGGWKDAQPYRDIIIELAGGQPVEVAGTAINLFNNESVWVDLRELDLALSMDGKTFTPVLNKKLQPIKTEQYFTLDEPLTARFARLRLEHTFDGNDRNQINLAEWKVIARPGVDISQGQGFNLADLDLGGHIVYSRPQVSVHWDQTLLRQEKAEGAVSLNASQGLEFVVGFHHNRAAQISKLEWEKSSAPEHHSRFTQVQVAVSLESPHGPWKPLGILDLAGPDLTAVMTLDQFEWARFVKFTTPSSDSRRKWVTPEQIKIWERPTESEYRSILTEWGYGSKAAIFESLQDLDIDQPLMAAGNDSRERAAVISPGQSVAGVVSLGQYVQWWALTVPSDQNTLMIKQDGDPTVRTILHMENEAGESIPLRRQRDLSTSRSHHFEAVVDGGGRYYLRVEEPPRNVVFTWDTSASVQSYIPTIYNSLVAFTEDVVPGRDAVNLIPFGRGPLLRDWYGEPYILQTVLNDYLRRGASSSAEQTLRTASRELAPLAGTKAIVVVTDAATPRDAKMWDEFERVRPRVFGIGVGGGISADEEQDLLQDWTDVNAGDYRHMVYDGEMEIAFDRAATMLRRPAEYTLLVETEFVEDPGPGTLRVVSGEGGAAYAGAVELILDASGSMLQRLDGKRRINIAKDVLIEAVEKHIPPGTPTALRVFGHKEPNACRTDLEIALKPLDPGSASRTIASIQAMNLAKTPIADSLAAIEKDLSKAQGSKVVVVVTDGEETCEGKPGDVIQKLRDKGFDVTLNIVGFAIGDAELEAQFADWAELGGGRYFSANNQEGLSTAITTALQTPYTVYDSSGTRVASGLVGGEPVELEAAYYRVVVSTSPQQTFEEVDVQGASEVLLELE